ncbi:MAG: 1-phosphofructokinase family hexose kinase [Candidatus Omnitrophica bacterium]|nr:1-phosphofructokinase family hexose kinase [Candidatus Omnitrophota bacterium]
MMPSADRGRKYVLTVTLNTTIDTMMDFHQRSGNLRIQNETSVAGGKGVNVSRCLQFLSCPNYATGVVGGTTGRRIKQLLRVEKLRHRFYHNRSESRHNLILCVPDLKTANRIFGQTPAITAGDYGEFYKMYGQLIARACLIVLSGSVLRGLPATVYAQLIRRARQRGIPVVLDASGPALREGLKARPQYIKPNRTEIQQATGITVRSLSDAVRAAASFRRMHIENIFLSLGESGAIGCNHNELWYAKAPKVTVRNTVGCGDAFVAAMCVAILQNKSLRQTLGLAVAAGSVNAGNIVPGRVNPAAVQQVFKQIKQKRIPF